jgi:hypothetical protein
MTIEVLVLSLAFFSYPSWIFSNMLQIVKSPSWNLFSKEAVLQLLGGEIDLLHHKGLPALQESVYVQHLVLKHKVIKFIMKFLSRCILNIFPWLGEDDKFEMQSFLLSMNFHDFSSNKDCPSIKNKH